MRTKHFISAAAIFLSFGATALEASTAQAAPCCSSPMCQRLEPPPVCYMCQACAVDEEAGEVSEEAAYDEAAGMCLAPVEAELAPGEEGEADEVEPGPCR